MKRISNAEVSFQTLDDEELGEVTGGCHGRHRRHGHKRSGDEGGGSAGSAGGAAGAAGAGDLSSLLQLLQQTNVAAIFQFVIGENNTVSATVAQANLGS